MEYNTEEELLADLNGTPMPTPENFRSEDELLSYLNGTPMPQQKESLPKELGKAVVRSGYGVAGLFGNLLKYPSYGMGKEVTDWAQKGQEEYAMGPETQQTTVPKGVLGGIESLGPSAAAGIPGFITGAAIGTSTTGPLAPVGGWLGGAIGAGVSGASIMGLAEYQNYLDEYRQATGKEPDDKTRSMAGLSAVIEGGFEGLSNFLEGLTLFSSKAARPGLNTVKEALKTPLKAWAKKFAEVEISETLPEMATAYGEAKLRQAQGIPTADPWEAAKDAIIPSLTMGAIFNLAGGGLKQMQTKQFEANLSNAEADINDRINAAKVVEQSIREEGNNTAADMWANYAMKQIDERNPIDIDMTLDKTSLEIEMLDGDLKKNLGLEEPAAQPTETPVEQPYQVEPGQMALQPSPEQAAIGGYDYFRSLEGVPISQQETTDQAIERLSSNPNITDHEKQQLFDLVRSKEIPDTNGPLSLPEETRHLINKVVSSTNKPAEIIKAEIMNMVDWYQRAYPKPMAMKALRNRLLDTVYGRYTEAEHGKEYKAELQRVADARKGIYPEGQNLPGEKRIGMIPKQASKTYTEEFKTTMKGFINYIVARWTDNTRPFYITEEQIDTGAGILGVDKKEMIEYLGGEKYNGKTGIPILPYKETYEIEFEKQVPKPKRGREARPLYSWLSKQGKFSKSSIMRAFGENLEDAKSLGLGRFLTNKGGQDFLQVITEDRTDNPFLGSIDMESTDAANIAADMLRNERKIANEGNTYRNAIREWESQRDAYVQEQLSGKKTAINKDTASDTFIEETDLESQLLERARRLGSEYLKEMESLVKSDIPYEDLDDLLKTYEEKGTETVAQEDLTGLWGNDIDKLKENARLAKERALEKKDLKEKLKIIREHHKKAEDEDLRGRQQFDSIEELERWLVENGRSVQTPHGIRVGYYKGEPVYERMKRVYAPDPMALVEIARQYSTAEKFEDEWNEDIREELRRVFPSSMQYGWGDEPMPIGKVNRIIRAILQKYDADLEELLALDDAASAVITDDRDFNILQDALDNQRMFLKAYWAIPEKFNYRKFWNDVSAGKTDDELKQHFLKGNDREQDELFQKIAEEDKNVKVVDVTDSKGWVQTTVQFMKNIRANRRFKPEENIKYISPKPKGYYASAKDIKASKPGQETLFMAGISDNITIRNNLDKLAQKIDTLNKLNEKIVKTNTRGVGELEGNPFGTKQVVTTDSVPREAAILIQSWLKLFKMDTKVLIAGQYDLNNITTAKLRYGLTGYGRGAIFAANNMLNNNKRIKALTGAEHNRFGANKGERFIILSHDMTRAFQQYRPSVIECIAHEFGHIMQFEILNKTSETQYLDILIEYNDWLDQMKEGTIDDYLKTAIAGPGTLHELPGIDLIRSRKLNELPKDRYEDITSFEEWFANQVARWMISKEKPMTFTERLFKRIADAWKKLYSLVDKELFRPAQSVEVWLNKRMAHNKAMAPRDRGMLGLPLFDDTDIIGQTAFHGSPDSFDKFSTEDVRAQAINDKTLATEQLFPAFDEADWQRTHAQESIVDADDVIKEGTQRAERELNPEMHYKANANKPFRRYFRQLMDKYGIMKKRDIGKIETHLANPFFLGYKYPEIAAAVRIQINRDESRNELIHNFMQASNTFFRLEGDSLNRVEKALIMGDRELRQRYSDLMEENTESSRRAAQELKELDSYSDNELVTRFKLNAEGLAAYRQVRSTLKTIHDRWLQQIEDRNFEIFRKEKWYALLKSLHGSNLNDDDLRMAKDKLGKLYTQWDKTLKAARIPLNNLLHTPESLAKIQLYMENIVTKAMDDIRNGENMTEARARAIVRRAISRLTKTEEMASQELNETQINAMVQEYTRQYNKSRDSVNGLRNVLREHILIGANMTDEEVNKQVRGLIQAYGKTRPYMAEVKRIRNELGQWIAYFPRERDDSKLHYIRVYKNIRDDDGTIIDRELKYINYYNLGALGGESLRKEIEKTIATEGWKDVFVEQGRNIKDADSTFFKVSDMNTQRIIDNAIAAAYNKGKLTEKEGEDTRQMLLQAISDEMNQRGFGKHRLSRQVAYDDDNKIRTILGYKETDLKNVLKNYITGYAGMETKQLAAIKYTDLFGKIDTTKKGIRDYVHTYSQEQLRNQERIDKISGTMRAIAFAWYLGGNFKSVFVQLTQNYVTGIPFLAQEIRKENKVIRRKAGFMEAERRYHSAMNDVATKHLTEDEKIFLDEAIHKGITMDQYIQEITGRINASFGGKYRRVVGTLSYFFSQAETFNRKSASLAMYRFLKESGHDTNGGKVDSEVGRRVEQFVHRTHYLMGKANLPKSMMGGELTSQTLRTAYAFRPFTHNYILSLLPQYGGDAKTALHSLAYLALLGGMLSVPFLKDLFDWWEKRTGENILGDVRKELRKYGGKTLETFGVYGLAGLVLGDISGSLAMGIPFVGEPTDTMYGVWGGMARKAKQSGQASGKGDWYRGIENISPEALANIMRGLRMSEFGKNLIGTPGYATTQHGRPVFDETGKPLSMDTMDTFRKIIGFQPVEYSQRMKARQAVMDKEKYFENKRKDITEEYRIAKLNNSQRGIAKALKDIQQFNKDRIEKDATLIVAPLRLSNVIRSSRQTATKKERKETLYKQQMEL